MGSWSFSPAEVAPTELYRILSGTVIPRPIALVSTLSEMGHANLSPFSYFMLGGGSPASLCFSPTLGSRGQKDTLSNILSTREFVVHLVDRSMADGMNATSASFPAEFDEWEVSGLTKAAGKMVKPMRAEEAPVAFECHLLEVVEHGTSAGAARYVIGEIVFIHIREDLLVDGRFEGSRMKPLSRLGGAGYLDLANLELFDMDRP